MEHTSEGIRSIISNFEKIDAIQEIWEIGSRDGQDAKAMLEVFPFAKVKCFEPNPDTFKLVEDVSKKSFGKIVALNIALSDSDGEITFHKIDTSSTVTTWQDGNPGASSMFIASPDYDVEKYFQIAIKVRSHQAKTLIESQGFSIPNFIWMDVQGAEKLVIQGFGRHLSSVDFIYVELSLKPLYLGQPLAIDVVKLLSKDFYWYANLSTGSWQFDALFVNKKYSSYKLLFRNLLLLSSLKSNLKVGIEYSLGGFCKKSIRGIVNRSYFKTVSVSRKSDSQVLGVSVRRVFLSIASMLKLQELPFRFRQLISLSQPSNPLKDEALPTIDVAIPCHAKDFENLPLVIQGLRANVMNPVEKIILITPEYLSQELQTKFPDLHVLTDENVLGVGIADALVELVPQERRGWITQQLIKFQVAMSSDMMATLILDADTILLKPRIFIDAQGIQILCVASEFHTPYKKHQRRVFGGQNYLLSFVTHHQLMKKDTLRAIFGQNGEGLLQFIKLADYSEFSAVSEYDTYGEWAITHRRSEIAFAKWNNLTVKIIPDKTSYEEIKVKYSLYHSISTHSHL
jgi:FkbM family methyltransferase